MEKRMFYFSRTRESCNEFANHCRGLGLKVVSGIRVKSRYYTFLELNPSEALQLNSFLSEIESLDLARRIK